MKTPDKFFIGVLLVWLLVSVVAFLLIQNEAFAAEHGTFAQEIYHNNTADGHFKINCHLLSDLEGPETCSRMLDEVGQLWRMERTFTSHIKNWGLRIYKHSPADAVTIVAFDAMGGRNHTRAQELLCGLTSEYVDFPRLLFIQHGRIKSEVSCS